MPRARSRRGSASGVAAIIATIMIIATAVSGAVIYYDRGGASPSVGASSPSGALSGPALGSLTSALGGLQGNLSGLALSNSTLLGGLSNPALTNLTSDLGGLSGGLSNSTFANLTAALGGHISVVASSLPAADFTASGGTSTFACAGSPSSAYLTLTDNETGSTSVSSVSIASTSAVTRFTASGSCEIAASGQGLSTLYVLFPVTSKISPSPQVGEYYTGVVTMSDGSLVPFAGLWQ